MNYINIMIYRRKNTGQSEVIGQILLISIVVLGAGLIGSFYLSSFGSTDPNPAASVDYEVNLELVNTPSGEDTRYVLTVTATSMERADELTVYYNESGVVGSINSIGSTTEIGDDGTIEIQDGDRFVVVANYEGTERIISTYTFNEEYWENQNDE